MCKTTLQWGGVDTIYRIEFVTAPSRALLSVLNTPVFSSALLLPSSRVPLMATTAVPSALPLNSLSAIVLHALDDILPHPSSDTFSPTSPPDYPEQSPDALLFILPLLIVLSTFLFVLLLFLVCIIFIRRRRGIVLRDNDGPIDMSREDLYEGDGGFEGVESRWLESVSDSISRSYLRAKGPFILSPHRSNPVYSISSLCFQSINYSIPLTRNQLTSPYRNFSPYRKRESPLGASNPTMKPSIHFLFTLAPRSPFSLIPHQLHVFNQICLFQS